MPDTSVRGRTEKMSRLRTVIARRMVESLQVSAQLTTVVEADVTRIANLRQQAKKDFEAREGVKLSFLPFFAKAAIEALKAHPSVNSSIDQEAGTVTYHDTENLGVAVDTERGLLVPVIHDAGDLSLGGIARKIADLAERTRTNKITPDELGGGTFTLTNTGSRGALFDTPIINQPQVAILGLGSVVKRPVVVQDDELGEVIAVRSMVYLALTYDHRIVDGADAARFLTTVRERLEAGQFQGELGLGLTFGDQGSGGGRSPDRGRAPPRQPEGLAPAEGLRHVKVAVTGASGLIGGALVEALRSDGHEVLRLVRRTPRTADEHRWDPQHHRIDRPAAGRRRRCRQPGGRADPPAALDRSYKERLLTSRLDATTTISEALAVAAAKDPDRRRVLLSASAVGYYGDTGSRPSTRAPARRPTSWPACAPGGRRPPPPPRRRACGSRCCAPAW